MKLISIVIPCYRSAKTLPYVAEEVKKIFTGREDYDYEMILVNDGSPDDTFDVIRALCEKDDHITGVNLSKNFGQSSAKMAAIPYVHGDIMVTMDDDGQHPAAGIFPLAEKVQEGYDLVYAYFPHKKHSLFKRITSWMNNRLQTLMKMKDSDIQTSSFVAYSSFAIKMIKESRSPVNALSSYVRRLSKRVANVELPHRERLEGHSNYTLKRLFRLWRNSITSFSTQALSMSIYLGGFTAFAGFVYAVVILIKKLMHPNMVVGYASTMIVMLVLSGIIMVLLGILGEYVGKIFLIMVRLPNYLVREEVLNCFCEENNQKKE